MGNQKLIVSMLILIAVLLLGIAYAAVTTETLAIKGSTTAQVDEENFKVCFDQEISPKTTVITGSGILLNDQQTTVAAEYKDETNATLDIKGLTAEGDEVTATYTIKSESRGLNAAIDTQLLYDANEYFSVTKSLEKTTLGEEDSTRLTIKVKMLKTPVTTVPQSTITIKITASPVQI